jgi:hypothetical protein
MNSITEVYTASAGSELPQNGQGKRSVVLAPRLSSHSTNFEACGPMAALDGWMRRLGYLEAAGYRRWRLQGGGDVRL